MRARCASATQHVHNLSASFDTSPYPSLRSDRVILAVVMLYLTGLRVTVCGSGGVLVKGTGLGIKGWMNRGRGLGKTREYSEEEAAVLGTKGLFLRAVWKDGLRER